MPLKTTTMCRMSSAISIFPKRSCRSWHCKIIGYRNDLTTCTVRPLPLRERIENLSEFPFGEIRLDFLGEGVLSARPVVQSLPREPPHQVFLSIFCVGQKILRKTILPFQGGGNIFKIFTYFPIFPFIPIISP